MKKIASHTQQLFLLIILTFFMPSPSQAQKGSTLKDFSWIIGTWKMSMKNGTLFEKWRMINDSVFQSTAFRIKSSGDTVMTESVKIEYKNKSFYYTSTVTDQNNQKPVPFKITSFSQSGFTAENPAHDFPQRISYELKSDGQLYAFIDGKYNGKYGKKEFSYIKVK